MKIVDFSRILTWINGVVDKHADNLTTTLALSLSKVVERSQFEFSHR